MNYENLNQIVETLEELSPRRAKKLKDLLKRFYEETDPVKLDELYQNVWNYLYNIFLSCLSKESKNSLVGAIVGINEMCYYLEQKAKDGWTVNSTGAYRVETVNDDVKIVGVIPREYGKGFFLKERIPETEKERTYALKELDFYTNYEMQLAVLGGEMDFKETFLTHGYQIRSSRIPKEFVELLINTLNLNRADPEKVSFEQNKK